MPDRHFLADADLDAILDHLPAPTTLPVSTVDQIDAASREVAGMTYAMVAAAAAHGDRAFFGALTDDPEQRKRAVRPRLRMMLAAFSAGITHLCDHTRQIRPLLISCDPPVLVCMNPACLAKVDDYAVRHGFRWDNHCDACGKPTSAVHRFATVLGPLTISGHLCKACADGMTKAAAPAVAEVRTISRKDPCPCGSGRRFKACHGRTS
jgi:hypothetical protein